jgi:hypothetical protein
LGFVKVRLDLRPIYRSDRAAKFPSEVAERILDDYNLDQKVMICDNWSIDEPQPFIVV